MKYWPATAPSHLVKAGDLLEQRDNLSIARCLRDDPLKLLGMTGVASSPMAFR